MRVRRPRVVVSTFSKHQLHVVLPLSMRGNLNSELNVRISGTSKFGDFILFGMEGLEMSSGETRDEVELNMNGKMGTQVVGNEVNVRNNHQIVKNEPPYISSNEIPANWLYKHPSIKDKAHQLINNGNILDESVVLHLENSKYVLKTVNTSELSFLIRNIDTMRRYWETPWDTLIPRILGVYSTRTVNLIVIEELFSNFCGKVTDIGCGTTNTICVKNREEILRILRRDVEFLESLGVVGYSLRIGVEMNEVTKACLVDFMTIGRSKMCLMCCSNREAETYSEKYLNSVTRALNG